MFASFIPVRGSWAAFIGFVIATVGLAATGPRAAGGVIVDHPVGAVDLRYDRYVSGFPAAPVVNTSGTFVGTGLDLSGIGWFTSGGTNFQVAMVSERHFIAATHSPPGPGTILNFFDPVGNVVRNYTVQSTNRPAFTQINPSIALPADVTLGLLTAPIPVADRITSYPIASGPESSFVNFPTLHYGQNPARYGAGNQIHIGRNNVQTIGTVSFDGPTPVDDATRSFAFDWTPANPGEIYLVGGDSGGPSFIVLGGRPVLLGTHMGVSVVTETPNPGDQSIDTFLPYYISQLNAFMAQDIDGSHPNGYSLAVQPVPEPGTLALTGVVAAGAWWWRLRRRRGAAR